MPTINFTIEALSFTEKVVNKLKPGFRGLWSSTNDESDYVQLFELIKKYIGTVHLLCQSKHIHEFRYLAEMQGEKR